MIHEHDCEPLTHAKWSESITIKLTVHQYNQNVVVQMILEFMPLLYDGPVWQSLNHKTEYTVTLCKRSEEVIVWSKINTDYINEDNEKPKMSLDMWRFRGNGTLIQSHFRRVYLSCQRGKNIHEAKAPIFMIIERISNQALIFGQTGVSGVLQMIIKRSGIGPGSTMWLWWVRHKRHFGFHLRVCRPTAHTHRWHLSV